MKILSWNCQGLGNPWTIRHLCHLVWGDRPSIIFLMETMICKQELMKVRNICGYANGVDIDSRRNSRGMGLWWEDANVVVIEWDAHHILFKVVWYGVGIHGWSVSGTKHLTFDLMRDIRRRCNGPLVMIGDFNEIV